jgi:hypothetical protein
VTELEIRGVRAGLLLDEPLLLSAGRGDELLWRARYRDDDSRVWRAAAARAPDLLAALGPAKPSTGPIAALTSLRPVRIDVRVEAPDGRAAGRAVTRLVVAKGVRLRRWRGDGLAGTLHLPAAAGPPCSTVVVDGTGGPRQGLAAALAGPLLASRGVLVLTVGAGSVEEARERLTAVPAASEPVLLAAADPLGAESAGGPTGGGPRPAGGAVVLPPGVGVRGEAEGGAVIRAAAWDELLARLGAVSRQSERSG